MEAATLDYTSAFRYTASWAASVHANTTDLTRNADEFYGVLGSLSFEYSTKERVLHVWSFVSDSASPLLSTRAEVKTTIDEIAREHPDETAGGVFDIRTLEWNRQAGPELEPCLWLRFDIRDSSQSPAEIVKELDHFSTTGFNWNRHKMIEVLRAYWKAHPKS